LTADDLKDAVVGALSAVLLRVNNEGGIQSSINQSTLSHERQPRGNQQVSDAEEEVPPLPSPLPISREYKERRRK